MSKFNFIYAEDLSHREKTVYIYLRDRADASGVCWPGIKTIAIELGLSPRTVQRALADLERRQLIEKRQRHRANVIWIRRVVRGLISFRLAMVSRIILDKLETSTSGT